MYNVTWHIYYIILNVIDFYLNFEFDFDVLQC